VAVELVHLELPLEVGDHAEPLHDRLGLPPPCEVDDELAEDGDLHVRQLGERLAQEPHPLVEREQRRLVLRAADHTDDDAVEDRRRAADHVDVAERDGIVGPGTDGGDHGSKSVRRAEP
jgi:hypothetical protein